MLQIQDICVNDGRIPGLPKNPRFIKDERFEKLKRSISDFPEMLDLREVVVFPYKKKYVCIGGNMRYLACQDLGYTEIPAKILPVDFPVEKLREFAIKDNADFGEHDFDVLANEWSELPLEDWGVELPELDGLGADDGPNLGDPNFNYQSQYGVIVQCKNEKHQQKVYDDLAKAGYEVKVVVV